MSFCARYHFIPSEWVSRRRDPRNNTRSKPDITPCMSFSNLAINCCMAFLLGPSLRTSSFTNVHPRRNACTVCGLPLWGAGGHPAAGWSPRLPRALCKPQQADCQSAAGSQPAPQCIPPIRLSTQTNLFFKVELEHDADENPQRIGDEIRRHLKKLFGVRDVELSNITSEEEWRGWRSSPRTYGGKRRLSYRRCSRRSRGGPVRRGPARRKAS